MACLMTVAFPVKGPNFISPNGGLNPNNESASSCVIGGRLGEKGERERKGYHIEREEREEREREEREEREREEREEREKKESEERERGEREKREREEREKRERGTGKRGKEGRHIEREE